MRFQLAEIKDAKVVQRDEQLNAADVIGTPPAFVVFNAPLQAHVKAQMTTAEVVMTGRVKTTVVLSCGRCLEKFEHPLDADFQQVYGLENDEIDVTPEIREAILIDAPYKRVCKENCGGLCASCGENKNTGKCTCSGAARDPRWDALKQIRL